MNSPTVFFAASLSAILLAGCKSNKPLPATIAAQATAKEAAADMPILAVKKGDFWRYQVHVEIPANVTAAGAVEVDESHQRTRTYLGKISPANGLPAVDCFEVVAPKAPAEREFVEIHADKILLRGSMIMRPETTRPMWLDQPIPFVIAGMKPGTVLPEFDAGGGKLSRKTQVVMRETIAVPAGSFPCIRILMTGKDGEFELNRTTWFSPGHGIIREEKIRYLKDKLILRETQELVATSLTL